MYYISKDFVITSIMVVKRKKFGEDYVTLRELNDFVILFQKRFSELNLNICFIDDMDNYYFKMVDSLIFLNNNNKVLLENVIEKCNFYCPNEETRKAIFDENFVYQSLLEMRMRDENKNLGFVPSNLETILNKILDNPRKFYEYIAKELSREEYNFIKEQLYIKRSCSNCTSFCCGGLCEEQASECGKWSNDELVGKVKVLSIK